MTLAAEFARIHKEMPGGKLLKGVDMDITNVLHGLDVPTDHPDWERALLRQLASLPHETVRSGRPVRFHEELERRVVLPFRQAEAA